MRRTFIALGLATALAAGGLAATADASQPRPSHFTILGETLCFGAVPATIPCDVRFTPRRQAALASPRTDVVSWLESLEKQVVTGATRHARAGGGTVKR